MPRAWFLRGGRGWSCVDTQSFGEPGSWRWRFSAPVSCRSASLNWRRGPVPVRFNRHMYQEGRGSDLWPTSFCCGPPCDPLDRVCGGAMPFGRGASSCQLAGLPAGLFSAVQGRVRLAQPSERSLGGRCKLPSVEPAAGESAPAWRSPRSSCSTAAWRSAHGELYVCVRLSPLVRWFRTAQSGCFRLRLLDTVAMSAAMQERAHCPVQL